jgi:hypothetical protein
MIFCYNVQNFSDGMFSPHGRCSLSLQVCTTKACSLPYHNSALKTSPGASQSVTGPAHQTATWHWSDLKTRPAASFRRKDDPCQNLKSAYLRTRQHQQILRKTLSPYYVLAVENRTFQSYELLSTIVHKFAASALQTVLPSRQACHSGVKTQYSEI